MDKSDNLRMRIEYWSLEDGYNLSITIICANLITDQSMIRTHWDNGAPSILEHWKLQRIHGRHCNCKPCSVRRDWWTLKPAWSQCHCVGGPLVSHSTDIFDHKTLNHYWSRILDPREQQIGEANREVIQQALGSLALFPFTNILGMEIEEYTELIRRARLEACDRTLKTYFPL